LAVNNTVKLYNKEYLDTVSAASSIPNSL